jgi:ABC-type branched-subunit amino acid transport system permease subunit
MSPLSQAQATAAIRADKGSRSRTLMLGAATVAVLMAVGLVMPRWLLFLATMAVANAVVSLGIVVLMRSGVVSFGQGLAFAAGGYAAALAFSHLGLTDALALPLLGGLAAVLIALPFAPLLARYRGIFFATLTLALSMVLYGILNKTDALGGSDGFNVARATLLGVRPGDEAAPMVLWSVTLGIAGILGIAVRLLFDSTRGMVARAVRDNELRVEYLGVSVSRLMATNFLLSAFLGGVGGALVVLALGHIDPNFSYWTTSGEFVFVAILAGHNSVMAVYLSALVLEIVRSFSSAFFPNTWQLALGVFLLVVIRFLPGGLGSLWHSRGDRR